MESKYFLGEPGSKSGKKKDYLGTFVACDQMGLKGDKFS